MASALRLPTTGYRNPRTPDHPLVTAWFNPDTRPTRTGLYQVLQEPSMYSSIREDEILWCWFDAEKQGWGWAYRAKRDAMAKQWRDPVGATQRRIWRGLVQPL